jgi:ATP-dependent RNA helicase DeaD
VKDGGPFGALGLSAPIVRAIHEMGFEKPTPIQERAIPAVLARRDVIGQARTGTGKTGAYALPAIEILTRTPRPEGGAVRVLVLVPTRELAVQVAGEVQKMGTHAKVRELAVYGGASIERQVQALRKGIDVVAGTPGRVIDLTNRRELKLDRVQLLVLDEADRMLDMGFIDDIKYILSRLPKERQTMMFSATIPPEIRALADDYLKAPEFIQVSADTLTVPTTEQVYYRVGRRNKVWALARILEAEKPERALIFCNTKRGCDLVVRRLKEAGFRADALHGDFSQARREAVLGKFRAGTLKLLVASDVAARGLDIEETTHVINYDTPDSVEAYVHRIGRTSRAGREGKAITFVTREDEGPISQISVVVGARIKEEQLGEPKSSDRVRKVVDFDHLANAFGMVPVTIEVGSKDGLKRYDLLTFLKSKSRVSDAMLGHVVINESDARFEVHKSVAERLLRSIERSTFNGRRLNARTGE